MFTIEGEVPRHNTLEAQDILDYAPLLVVQGARQVGKTTLMRQALESRDGLFLTLDDAATRTAALQDPRGFVEQAPDRTLVIDEAQRVPELALALKAAIDSDRRAGRWAITGSSDLLRLPGVSDSLAGRAESLTVWPLSQGEMRRHERPEDWVYAVVHNPDSFSATPYRDVDAEVREAVIRGGYPEPLKRDKERAVERWFMSYAQRLATHDAQQLTQRGDFRHHLDSLLRIISSQGQAELVKAKLARSLAISETALAEYLSLLDQMYLVDSLPAWGIGYSRRVVRKPKISLADTGFATTFTGLTMEKSRLVGGMELFGATLEAFVAGELRKQQGWSRLRYRLFHFRQREQEVDIVIELNDARLVLVEVKSARDVDQRAWRNMELLMEKLGDRVMAGVVLYMGDGVHTVRRPAGRIQILPVSSLWKHAY